MALALEHLLPVLAALNSDRAARVPLDEIAGGLGLSPWYVQRTFARLVGESPKQYRLRLRLECAAALLLSRDETVLDIALAVGFDSHEGFTRAFRRRYGIAPKAYRARRDGPPESFERHAELVARIGPCVHLFHAPLERNRERKPMSYDITRQPLTETPILVMKRKVETERLAEALGEILPAIFAYSTENGLAMAGPPFTRYLEFSPAYMTIEAGMPLAVAHRPPADRADILAAVLPGGEAAVTIHTGPYEELGDAHAAVERWIADNDLEPGGHPWEVYLTDPGEVPDPAEWKTQILWPLAG